MAFARVGLVSVSVGQVSENLAFLGVCVALHRARRDVHPRMCHGPTFEAHVVSNKRRLSPLPALARDAPCQFASKRFSCQSPSYVKTRKNQHLELLTTYL